ncbi:hypothetical protein ScPMuIL_008982 [Solemya velum]
MAEALLHETKTSKDGRHLIWNGYTYRQNNSIRYIPPSNQIHVGLKHDVVVVFVAPDSLDRMTGKVEEDQEQLVDKDELALEIQPHLSASSQTDQSNRQYSNPLRM